MVNNNNSNNKETVTQTGPSVLDYRISVDIKDIGKSLDIDKYINLDPINEDEIERKFLLSKPTCFLVIGKPGAGKTTIAKKLAEEWRAQLVNPTDLILENIKEQNEMGKKAQDILMRGEALPEEMVAIMINDKMNSPEVAHHGYVLEGFPCQSESDLDISKQMEMLKNWKLQPDFIINLRVSDWDLNERRIKQKVDPVSGVVYIKRMYAPDKTQKKSPKEGEEAEEEEGDEEEEEEEEEEEKQEEPIVS
jgi:adenylate/nucleoside-diphosphate kinase